MIFQLQFCTKDEQTDTTCKTCTIVVTGPNIETRTSSFTACGDELKNVFEGETNVIISGEVCKSRTTCR